jgi:hypothetical protein
MKPPVILLILSEIFVALRWDSLIEAQNGEIIVSRRRNRCEKYVVVKRYT